MVIMLFPNMVIMLFPNMEMLRQFYFFTTSIEPVNHLIHFNDLSLIKFSILRLSIVFIVSSAKLHWLEQVFFVQVHLSTWA